MKSPYRQAGRFIALFLTVALTLPQPAFALRPEAKAQQTAGLEELEQALRDSNDPFRATAGVLTRQVANAIGVVPANPALGQSGGLEEGGRIKKLAQGAVLVTAGVVAGIAGKAAYDQVTAPPLQPPAQVAPEEPGAVVPEDRGLPEAPLDYVALPEKGPVDSRTPVRILGNEPLRIVWDYTHGEERNRGIKLEVQFVPLTDENREKPDQVDWTSSTDSTSFEWTTAVKGQNLFKARIDPSALPLYGVKPGGRYWVRFVMSRLVEGAEERLGEPSFVALEVMDLPAPAPKGGLEEFEHLPWAEISQEQMSLAISTATHSTPMVRVWKFRNESPTGGQIVSVSFLSPDNRKAYRMDLSPIDLTLSGNPEIDNYLENLLQNETMSREMLLKIRTFSTDNFVSDIPSTGLEEAPASVSDRELAERFVALLGSEGYLKIDTLILPPHRLPPGAAQMIDANEGGSVIEHLAEGPDTQPAFRKQVGLPLGVKIVFSNDTPTDALDLSKVAQVAAGQADPEILKAPLNSGLEEKSFYGFGVRKLWEQTLLLKFLPNLDMNMGIHYSNPTSGDRMISRFEIVASHGEGKEFSWIVKWALEYMANALQHSSDGQVLLKEWERAALKTIDIEGKQDKAEDDGGQNAMVGRILLRVAKDLPVDILRRPGEVIVSEGVLSEILDVVKEKMPANLEFSSWAAFQDSFQMAALRRLGERLFSALTVTGTPLPKGEMWQQMRSSMVMESRLKRILDEDHRANAPDVHAMRRLLETYPDLRKSGYYFSELLSRIQDLPLERQQSEIDKYLEAHLESWRVPLRNIEEVEFTPEWFITDLFNKVFGRTSEFRLPDRTMEGREREGIRFDGAPTDGFGYTVEISVGFEGSPVQVVFLKRQYRGPLTKQEQEILSHYRFWVVDPNEPWIKTKPTALAATNWGPGNNDGMVATFDLKEEWSGHPNKGINRFLGQKIETIVKMSKFPSAAGLEERQEPVLPNVLLGASMSLVYHVMDAEEKKEPLGTVLRMEDFLRYGITAEEIRFILFGTIQPHPDESAEWGMWTDQLAWESLRVLPRVAGAIWQERDRTAAPTVVSAMERFNQFQLNLKDASPETRPAMGVRSELAPSELTALFTRVFALLGIPDSSSGLEEAQEVFDQLRWETGGRNQLLLDSDGYMELTAEQAARFGMENVMGGFIVADSAKVTDAGHFVVAEEGLRNEAAEAIFPWIKAEQGIQGVIDSAKDSEANHGDLLLIKPAEGMDVGAVLEVLIQRGYSPGGSASPRVAIGDENQVEALPPVAFQLLAGQKGIPPVVFLNVRVKLTDEAGNTYTLILMA